MILDYLIKNKNEPESIQIAEEMIEAIEDGGEVDFKNKIILDPSFTNNQKAKCIYDKMQNIEAVVKALEPFNASSPAAYLRFTMSSLEPSVRAETSEPDSKNIITITLNNNSSNDGVNYQPNTLVAQTIIHEIIHAEFFRQIIIAIGNGSFNADPIVIRDALANSEYTKLYEFYRLYKDWSHNLMATNYRRAIARVTQEYATGTPVTGIPNQLYTNLAWRGLTDYNLVKAWKDLVDSNPGPNGPAAQILNEISNYVTNNANQTCQ